MENALLCIFVWGAMIVSTLLMDAYLGKRNSPGEIEYRYQIWRNSTMKK